MIRNTADMVFYFYGFFREVCPLRS